MVEEFDPMKLAAEQACVIVEPVPAGGCRVRVANWPPLAAIDETYDDAVFAINIGLRLALTHRLPMFMQAIPDSEIFRAKR